MKLVFIYGFPGVGKFTVAKELSKKTGLKLFHNHMVLNLIIDVFGGAISPIIQLREKIWIDFFKQAAASELEGLIFTFCFDKYLSKDFLQKIERAIKPDDSICYIQLTCNYGVLEKRIQHSSRKTLNKLQDFTELIKQIEDKSFYLPKLRRNVLIIDNSNLSPKNVATRIINRFQLL